MSRTLAPLFEELEQESAATRRALERIPEDRLEWRPHPKSMTLGQLALHVASTPRALLDLAEQDGIDVSTVDFRPPSPGSKQEVLAAHDESLAQARKRLASYDAARADAPWRLHKQGQTIFEIPRVALFRSLMLNHLYHHRGQLSVYLRLLDVAVPATYGMSADEQPFR